MVQDFLHPPQQLVIKGLFFGALGFRFPAHFWHVWGWGFGFGVLELELISRTVYVHIYVLCSSKPEALSYIHVHVQAFTVYRV